MRTTSLLYPPDQGARDAIVHERERNVAVIAGAGTGKTKTVIDRAVELLAPRAAGVKPIAIQAMALITFTRRAAGELRFRIREQLLRELEREVGREERRAALLRDALANLDAAFVGTIHGFADRLLRLRPVEAALSPAYALVEDTTELVRETFLRLRRSAEAGSLRTELGTFAADADPTLIGEAAETLRAATRAGLQMQRTENVYGPVASLEATMARMIDTRDIAVELCAVPDPQLDQARAAVDRLGGMVKLMRGGELGHRTLRLIARALGRLRTADDPAEAFRIVQEALGGRDLRKGRDFNGDATGWDIYKAIRPQGPAKGWLAEQLQGPHRWLATRLVRLFPVVRAMYERVKAEHEVVDYLDLLIKLRNLLRDNLAARTFYQGLFEHIFVDEFQDTDPLQCEIVFYLCEDPSAAPPEGAKADRARAWDGVQLTPGKLTIVGDPKQSIYRFRRADIAMYGLATERLIEGGALEQRLETNFRSRPELIAFFNQQLAKVLGKDDGPAFDPQTGRANYEDLSPSATIPPGGVGVHVLPYADVENEGLLAPEGRPIEAAMLARYVRWLLDGQHPVRDPDTNVARPVRPGDIAVLAAVTTNLRLLLREFEAAGIEYSARGGALFLAHPLVRQYLLGLRALADRDDGVAVAALLQPPFFAVDRGDAVSARSNKDPAVSPRRARMEAAQAIVKELRARRHTQSPGATARDLIERTALGRTVVTGRNGRQTLAALYEVASELERRAGLEGRDYDVATELFRTWAENPIFLDAPEPPGLDAVRVMTTHSAKGLEFPVVILWDGYQTLNERSGGIWHVERDARAWALSLGPVAIEHPTGMHVLEQEKQFGDQERRRLYYVAATRARDLLALPAPPTKSKTLQYATSELGNGVQPEQAWRFETFRRERLPQWARGSYVQLPRRVVGDAALQEQLLAVQREFDQAISAAAQPVATPTAVTLEAAGTVAVDEIDIDSERASKAESERFGRVFGLAVHRSLQLILGGAIDDLSLAVSLAAQEAGLTEHLAEAEADTQRAMDALRGIGILDQAGATLVTEYPLAMACNGGKLMTGYIDLLVLKATQAMVIDFKTDAPPSGSVFASYPHYATQLRLYGEMVRAAGIIAERELRLGLLLTASGELHWLGQS
ncbi:MAG: UvrD-helicase domain-containing protein [Candidatus Binatia bacterium]|jgi:ATP-dependent helicase/nuclease subunit A